MNKKISVAFAVSVLFLVVPAKPISQSAAEVLSVLSVPFYYLGAKYSVGAMQLKNLGVKKERAQKITKKVVSGVGASALAAVTYKFFYQFTPSGRFDRASKIIENIKDTFPRVFEDVTNATQEQIFYELGAFADTHKNDRNFVRLNAVKELNVIAGKLKKAESLLVAANKDISLELFESCKIGAQKLYAKTYAYITQTASVEIEGSKNHIEIAAKIDGLLAEVRAMNDRVANLLGNIELFGSKEFKEQLKDYEDLCMMRSQKNRSAVINFAIPTATIAGSLAVLGVTGVSICYVIKLLNTIGLPQGAVRASHLNSFEY